MNFKNILIGIAIFILTSFVIVYGIQTFYPSPKYEDLCGREPYYPIENQTECELKEGKWITYQEKYPNQDIESNPEMTRGWCDITYNCYTEHENKMESYSRNIFIISLILGIIIIITGILLFSPEFIGGGISAGGIFSLLYGTTSYWRYAGNEFKFAISLIGLIILIIFGYCINYKLSKPAKKTKR